MSIKQGILFSHAFWLQHLEDGETEEILTWCNEKCQGQWVVLSGFGYRNEGVSISFRCKAQKVGPFEGEKYPSSRVELRLDRAISFELEKDAAMFKLTWMGET